MRRLNSDELESMNEVAQAGEEQQGESLPRVRGEEAERLEEVHRQVFSGDPLERRRARGDPAPSEEEVQQIHESLFGKGGAR